MAPGQTTRATDSTAQRAFDELPPDRKLALLDELFHYLEYSSDGTPGPELEGADTVAFICELFDRHGVKFTDPDDLDDEEEDEDADSRAPAPSVPDAVVTIVHPPAQELVDHAHRIYLNALHTAGQTDLVTLLRELKPRVYAPEAAKGETGSDRVVDLYGVSIHVVPTRDGLSLQIDTTDLDPTHAPLLVEVDDLDCGTFCEDRAQEVDIVDLDKVIDELRKLGVKATVEQSGGGTATLYAGEPVYDPVEQYERYPVQAGPGHFSGPGWAKGRAYREEFSIGLSDDGATESHFPPDNATETDIARMIGHVLRGEPPLTEDGLRVRYYEHAQPLAADHSPAQPCCRGEECGEVAPASPAVLNAAAALTESDEPR